MAKYSNHLLNFLPHSLTFLLMAMAVVSLFSFAAFLCGSEKAKRLTRRREKKSVRLGDSDGKSPVKRLQSGLSNKAMSLVKIMSWRKVQSEGDEEEKVGIHEDGFFDDDEAAVWRKTIIRGEKCRPLDFSGQILYDADGNLISDDHHDHISPQS